MSSSRQNGPKDAIAKRERILEVASSLFGGRDLSLVTMDEVALRSGVAKGTLYNYFSSKEDLYFSIIRARMDHLLEALSLAFRDEEDVRVRLRKFTVHTLMFLIKYPDFFRMLRKEEARPRDADEGGGRQLRERLRALLRPVIARGIEEGTIRSVPLDFAIEMTLGAIEGAAFRCIENRVVAARNGPKTDLIFEMVWRSLVDSDLAPERSLAGKRILVTREESGEDRLSERIRAAGGRPIQLPLIRTAPPLDQESLTRTAQRASQFAWILMTSARGVDAFADAFENCDTSSLPTEVRLGAVGEATASRLLARFGRCDLMSKGRTGADLAVALAARQPLHGCKILFPRAGEAREELPRALREEGAIVEEVIAYQTVPSFEERERLVWLLEEDEVDAITFASGSAVAAFASMIDRKQFLGREDRARIVSIGPTTSAELRKHGFDVDAEANWPRLGELVGACARALARSGIEDIREGNAMNREPEGGLR